LRHLPLLHSTAVATAATISTAAAAATKSAAAAAAAKSAGIARDDQAEYQRY
jgi:hypothetical protein